MAHYGKKLLFEDQRSVTAAAIAASGAAYLAVGSALDHPSRILKIDNLTDDNLQFSIDGINDHFVLHAMSSLILDVSTNQQPGCPYFWGKGTVLYVKEIDGPNTGDLYFSVMYGKGD